MDKRRVVCDGVKGVLTYHDGQWVLENKNELVMLQALGSSSNGLRRLLGITAALNSPAAGAGDVTRLNMGLKSIVRTEPVWAAGVCDDLMAATAVACAYWDHPKAIDWLCWAISARYSDNLSQFNYVSPGWNSFQRGGRRSRHCEYRRDAEWLHWVGDEFWERLAKHEEQRVREVAEAIDPNTPPERLEELYVSPYGEVIDVIDTRPDIPDSLLHHRAIKRQDKFVRRDVHDSSQSHSFELATLHNHRLAQNLSIGPTIIHGLASRSHNYTSCGFWRLLIAHPNRGNKTLDRISKSLCGTAMLWVASHPNTRSSTLKRILHEHPNGELALGRCATRTLPAWKIWAAAAANPTIPTSSLRELVESPLYRVRAAVASNPSARIADLEKLSADSRCEVRASAATNSKLPTALLEELAQDRIAAVRAAVATNPEAPGDLLAQLALDINPSVRQSIANHEDAPDAVLDMLASDRDSSVRMSVAANPEVPQWILARLAGDSDEDVRWEVARNPSSSAETLEQLADDSKWWIRMWAALHDSAPARMLEKLAPDSDVQVREYVALNETSPEGALAALASDTEPLVRSSVAANPSTPPRVLEQLSGDKCLDVLEELAANPSTPSEVLEQLAQKEWARVFHPALAALGKRQQAKTGTDSTGAPASMGRRIRVGD